MSGETEVVTTLTGNATQDDLTDAQYREIYDELRTGHSLEGLRELIGSEFSRALWNQYERGEKALNRAMKSELRRAVGLKIRPPTVTEAVEAHADPDAEVVKVGTGPATRVVLLDGGETRTLYSTPQGVEVEANGGKPAQSAPTTPAPAPRARNYRGLSVEKETYGEADTVRRELGLSWNNFVQQAIRLLKEEKERADQRG